MTNLCDILNQIGYTDLKDYGKQYSTAPLYRDSDNKTALTINKETGEWYDFVERIGGPLELLIEKTLGKPLDQVLKQKLIEGNFHASKKYVIELEHIQTFDKSLLLKLEKDHPYWIKRGVSRRVLDKFEGGFVNGPSRMAGRYVFPIFDFKENIIGFSGRYVGNNQDIIKWKHLGKKTKWCYPLKVNKEILLKSKQVILVESIGDMLALFENGIENVLVTFGVKVSPTVLEFLLKLDAQKIYISFNNDRDNNYVGNKAAQEAKARLSNYFDPSQIQIALPNEKNDFGEMSPEEISEWKIKNLI